VGVARVVLGVTRGCGRCGKRLWWVWQEIAVGVARVVVGVARGCGGCSFAKEILIIAIVIYFYS